MRVFVERAVLCSSLILLVYVPRINCGQITEDYCWRDYNGIAPYDAFKGGTDRTGQPIYIGQTLHDKKIIPGKIHINSTDIHIEFYKTYVLNRAIKIFCTPHPHKFEWVKTKYNEILDIKDKHIFEGGYEKGVTTYIGRAISHGEMTVGKVICWVDRCIKLTTIENGTWYDHAEFEILIYNGALYDDEPLTPPEASYGDETDDSKPSAFIYVCLVAITGLVIAVVVLLVRRC